MAFFEGLKMTGGYGTGPDIINSCSVDVNKGEIVSILGPNGAGKSSLIKTLVGDIAPLSGQVVPGEHLKIGYFAQHQLEALDMEANGLLHL